MSSTSIEFLNNLINLLKDNDSKQCIQYLLSNINIDTNTFNQIVSCFSRIIVEKQGNVFQLGQPSFGVSSNQSVSSNSSNGCFDENEFRTKAENSARSGIMICCKRMSNSSKNPNSFCCKAVKNPNNSLNCYNQVCGTHAPKNKQSSNNNVNTSFSFGLSNPTNNGFFQPQQNGSFNQGFQPQQNGLSNQGFQPQQNGLFNQGFQPPSLPSQNASSNQGFQPPSLPNPPQNGLSNQEFQPPSLPNPPQNSSSIQGFQPPSLPNPPQNSSSIQGFQPPSLPNPPQNGSSIQGFQPPTLPFQQPQSSQAPTLPFQQPQSSQAPTLPFQQPQSSQAPTLPLQFNALGEIQNNTNEGNFSINSSNTEKLSLPDFNSVTTNFSNISINNELSFFCRKYQDQEFYFCNSKEELKYLVFEIKDGNYIAINGINNGVNVNNDGKELSNAFFGYLGSISEIQKASLNKYGIKYQEKDNFDTSN
jgi:hypothetical protein